MEANSPEVLRIALHQGSGGILSSQVVTAVKDVHNCLSNYPRLGDRAHRDGHSEAANIVEVLHELDLAYEERWRLAYRTFSTT